MLLTNTNGIPTNLYYLLWIKNQGLLETTSLNVRIPDTLIFKGPQATFWYFTSENGRVLKKKTSQLNAQVIYDSFTEDKRSKSNILAQLMTDNKEIPVLTNSLTREQCPPKKDEKVMIRYLKSDDLKKFLFEELANQKMDQEIILQKFFDPPGEFNSVIEAIWSPSTCLFTRRINKVLLSNDQYDPYERAVTFDGPEIFSKAVCLKGKKISIEIRELCSEIVTRVSRVSYDKSVISRMTLFFKSDSRNRLTFLYCTSLRLAGEKTLNNPSSPQNHVFSNTPLEIDNNFIRPPSMRNTYSLLNQKPTNLTNDFHCVICEQMCQEQDITKLLLKHLLNKKGFSEQDEEKFLSNRNNLAHNKRLQNSHLNKDYEGNEEGLFKKKDKKNLIEVIPTPQQIMYNLSKNASNTQDYLDQNSLNGHPLIKKIFPKMTHDNFLDLKSEGYFNEAQIFVCHSCYLHLIKTSPPACAPLTLQPSDDIIVSSFKQPLLFSNHLNQKLLNKTLELSLAFPKAPSSNTLVFKQRLNLIANQETNTTLQKQETPKGNNKSSKYNHLTLSQFLSKMPQQKLVPKRDQESFHQFSLLEQLQSSQLENISSRQENEELSSPLSSPKLFNNSHQQIQRFLSSDNLRSDKDSSITSNCCSKFTPSKSAKSSNSIHKSLSTALELSRSLSALNQISSSTQLNKANLHPIEENTLSYQHYYAVQSSRSCKNQQDPKQRVSFNNYAPYLKNSVNNSNSQKQFPSPSSLIAKSRQQGRTFSLSKDKKKRINLDAKNDDPKQSSNIFNNSFRPLTSFAPSNMTKSSKQQMNSFYSGRSCSKSHHSSKNKPQSLMNCLDNTESELENYLKDDDQIDNF